jgi:DNA-directed RNA polymerase II subunit RPB2
VSKLSRRTRNKCLVQYKSGIPVGQEDSVIINQGAVDRGLFAITVYKTYTAEEKNQENQTIETIEAPIGCAGEKGVDKSKNYLKLDDQGIIREKSIVEEGDIIIRKTIRRDGKNSERMDCSVIHKLEETGFVDKVYITKNADGNKLVKVRVGFIRYPILGDKFASRHAQKGTCGIILPEVDMPFTSQGIRPDIIINPHAIPSRMTIAHLIECLTSKMAALTGEFQDATPFNDAEGQMVRHMEQVGSALHWHGFQSKGEEVMYSGMSGEKLTGSVFIGPTYYQRLKHMVMDKLSARSTGPVQNYTRQPANHGRKNGTKYTSIKMGTMETDAMASQGASASLRERLLLASDRYQAEVCDNCGMFCVGKGCKCEAGTTDVEMPFAFKLLHHNITALQIRASIKTASSTKSLGE